MGAVQSQFAGTEGVLRRAVSGAAQAADGDVLRTRLQDLRTHVARRAAVCWLQINLLITPVDWLANASRAAITGFERLGRAVETLSWKTVRSAIHATKWRKAVLVASEPFLLPREWRAALIRIVAYLSAIMMLSLIAAQIFSQQQISAMHEPAPRAAWIAVDKPWPAFEMSVPGMTDDMHYAIQRNPASGGRKDTMSFGELGKTQRFASVEIYRAGLEIETFGKTDDEIALRAFEYGRVVDMEETMPIPSKFGVFQVFEFAIKPFGSYRCIGFANAFDDQRMQISGMACNLNTIVDRSTISCALDRLSLVWAASDPEITRLFANAELRRDFCGQREQLMYATSKRPNDISSSAKPKLRGRLVR